MRGKEMGKGRQPAFRPQQPTANPRPTERPGPAPAGRPGPAPTARPVAGQPGQNPHPMAIVRTPNGGEIHRGPGGDIREVHTPNGAVIRYAPGGMRQVEMRRPDGAVVFANGNGRGGYIQRPFMVHNQAFVQRTYMVNGVPTVRVYRPWVYGGVTFNVYTPTHYYRPGFYSYAYRPWGQPVHYRWGWAGQPWYGYYGGYYAPYPFYASPVFWLTDFMVATTLQEDYQARMDSGSAPAPGGYDGSGMTPEVKQAISDEVRLQVEQERAEQQAMGQGYAQPPSGPPPLFADNVSRIFLVPGAVQAFNRGQECWLAAGDVLQLNGPPAPGATYADVLVLASSHRNLPVRSVVSVSLVDLQDMQNRMRANIDQGLGDLQSRQGQGGLPPMPAQNLGSSDAPFASAVQPDANVAGELSQAAQDANSSGQAVLGQSPAPAAPDQPAPGATVTLGMSAAEVHRVLGNPKQTFNLGSKQIEVFPNLKVTYVNGGVTDVQ